LAAPLDHITNGRAIFGLGAADVPAPYDDETLVRSAKEVRPRLKMLSPGYDASRK